VSLLSFDNSVAIKPFPISSIDFGQRALGHKAFHQVYGDLPSVARAKNNELWGEPFINHTASLAPPRDRRLRADMGETYDEWRTRSAGPNSLPTK
jgi:hypothetical protein